MTRRQGRGSEERKEEAVQQTDFHWFVFFSNKISSLATLHFLMTFGGKRGCFFLKKILSLVISDFLPFEFQYLFKDIPQLLV